MMPRATLNSQSALMGDESYNSDTSNDSPAAKQMASMPTSQKLATSTRTAKPANISTASRQTSAPPVSQTNANTMPATAYAVRTVTGAAASCSQPMETNVNVSTMPSTSYQNLYSTGNQSQGGS